MSEANIAGGKTLECRHFQFIIAFLGEIRGEASSGRGSQKIPKEEEGKIWWLIPAKKPKFQLGKYPLWSILGLRRVRLQTMDLDWQGVFNKSARDNMKA